MVWHFMIDMMVVWRFNSSVKSLDVQLLIVVPNLEPLLSSLLSPQAPLDGASSTSREVSWIQACKHNHDDVSSVQEEVLGGWRIRFTLWPGVLPPSVPFVSAVHPFSAPLEPHS